MPDVLIVAIARMGGDATAEKIMAQSGDLEISRLTLFTAEKVSEVSTHLRIHCIPRQGSAIGSGSHGTSVSADAPSLDYLKNIGISPDAAYYYNIAIDEGRSVITYNAVSEEASFIEERFRAFGFVKIRRFPFRTFAGAVR